MSIFDNTTIAAAFNARGYYVNNIALALDMGSDNLERLLNGTLEPAELRVGTLLNLANLLGIPFASLFTQPDPPTDPAEATGSADSDVVADAETLIAVLYDTGPRPTIIRDIATALDWDIDRLNHATKEARNRLDPAGLKLNRSHGEMAIIPQRDHTAARQSLAQVEGKERGLQYGQYRAVYDLLNNRPPSYGNSTMRRRVVMGLLVNAGMITTLHQPTLTPAIHEAFPN